MKIVRGGSCARSMIKLNLRPLPFGEIAMQDVLAVSYETVQGCEEDATVNSPVHDFNIALYKNNKLLNWVQLCPGADGKEIEFRNRFIDKSEECSEINELLLSFAEKWAAGKGYEKITVHACEVSVPYYLRMQYAEHGKLVHEKGSLLHIMVKNL